MNKSVLTHYYLSMCVGRLLVIVIILSSRTHFLYLLKEMDFDSDYIDVIERGMAVDRVIILVITAAE